MPKLQAARRRRGAHDRGDPALPRRRRTQLLRTETTAVDFFNARIERYPNHLARTDLWASARAFYGVGEYSEEDVGQILVAAGLES
jgi:hypothetical protein